MHALREVSALGSICANQVGGNLSASTLTLWGGDRCDLGTRERRVHTSPEAKGTLAVLT